MRVLSALLLFLVTTLAGATTVDTSRFLQLIDYIGVDYPGAVQQGKIVSEAEYAEMREFAATVARQAAELDRQLPGLELAAQAAQLRDGIEARADSTEIARLTATMRQMVVARFDMPVTPHEAPDLARAQALYMDNCASCHGERGQGNGPMARDLEPPPTNFLDLARYNDRTVYGLYSTISLGVEGTAMQSFAASLTESERWSLAFYVGQLAVAPDARAQGAALWPPRAEKQTLAALGDLKTLTTLTPNEAAQRFGHDGRLLMGYLRSHPQLLFEAGPAPLAFAREAVQASVQAYHDGRQDEAYRQALAAYLDGFELVEGSVAAVDRELKLEVEMAMTTYRQLIKRSAEVDAVEAQADTVLALLDRSVATITSGTLSSGAAFSGALVILLREGLEALLVIAALAAFLVKTERRDGLLFLHLGWGGALVAGVLTWIVSQYFINFSGASREITEGVAALIAMVVLFWVGFWLHSKTSAQQWKRFIEGSIHKALSTGTLWGIAGLSFIAVYREVFETILFYQAMWVQAAGDSRSAMLAGMGSAAGALAVLAWLILRYSARLPLRQFFSVTSVFMFVLAIIFAGKGVAALQEAGKLPMEPVNFPRIDFLGMYPSMEGLALQLGLMILAVVVYFGFSRKQANG